MSMEPRRPGDRLSAARLALILVDHIGFGPVTSIAVFRVPCAFGILPADLFRFSTDLLFRSNDTGRGQRILMGGECFGIYAVKAIRPSTIMPYDLIDDLGHASLLLIGFSFWRDADTGQ